jgi:hypothetical protein
MFQGLAACQPAALLIMKPSGEIECTEPIDIPVDVASSSTVVHNSIRVNFDNVALRMNALRSYCFIPAFFVFSGTYTPNCEHFFYASFLEEEPPLVGCPRQLI